jgi:hypothetical protein
MYSVGDQEKLYRYRLERDIKRIQDAAPMTYKAKNNEYMKDRLKTMNVNLKTICDTKPLGRLGKHI